MDFDAFDNMSIKDKIIFIRGCISILNASIRKNNTYEIMKIDPDEKNIYNTQFYLGDQKTDEMH